MLHLFETLYHLEATEGFFDVEIKGHRFWSYVRYVVGEQLYLGAPTHDAPLTRQVQWLRQLFWSTWHFVVDWLRIWRRRYDIVVVNTTDRCWVVEGKKINIYTYYLTEALRRQHRILLINPFYCNDNVRHCGCDVLRTRFLGYIDKVLSRLIRYRDAELASIKRIEQTINAALQTSLDLLQVAQTIYTRWVVGYRCYRWLLKRHRPKMICFSNNGNIPHILDAAQRLGVQCVEVQHSLISKLNMLYNYPANVDASVIPDYILTFGTFWTDLCHVPSRTIPVGFPHQEYMRKQCIAKHGERGGDGIVIISDGFFSRQALCRVTLVLADAFPDRTIYYKLRLEEYATWKTDYPASMANTRNLVMVDGRELELYDCFLHCAYQVGVNSTALYEGLAFDLITFVVNAGKHHDMVPLIERKNAFLVATGEEIVRMIRDGAKPDNTLPLDEVFHVDCSQAIHRAVQQIYANFHT